MFNNAKNQKQYISDIKNNEKLEKEKLKKEKIERKKLEKEKLEKEKLKKEKMIKGKKEKLERKKIKKEKLERKKLEKEKLEKEKLEKEKLEKEKLEKEKRKKFGKFTMKKGKKSLFINRPSNHPLTKSIKENIIFKSDWDIFLDTKYICPLKKYFENATSKNSLFLDSGWIVLKKHSRFFICTINSFNMKLNNYNLLNSVCEEKFQYISDNYINYNETIKCKKDGYIIIYLNNINGWWNSYLDINKIYDLINKIRSYVNNQIIIKLHPKNEKYKNKIKIPKNSNVIFDCNEKKWEEIIDNTYCIFIQQAKIIYELFAYGLPLFNLNDIHKINYFEEFYLSMENLKYEDLLENFKEIDRKNILKKYYSRFILKKTNDRITELEDWEYLSTKVLKNIEEYEKYLLTNE
jgi:hypothetical protein